MKVLIVDDNKPRQEAFLDWFSSIGISSTSVTILENTSEARAAITRNYFDLLLLDVVLPKRLDDTAAWSNGISLLQYIASSNRVKKPEKIIGITAYTSDLGSFKSEFEKFCLVVIEVKPGSSSWQPKLQLAINYTQSSKIARSTYESDTVAVTVHGIRTFGKWQERLKSIVQSESEYIDFHSYKYGYFSVIFFMIPYFQNREVKRLKLAFHKLAERFPDKKFIFFCHSFGTYIMAHALKDLILEGSAYKIKKIILSGSVLKSSFDWSFIRDSQNLKIVNECGTNDYILWLSEAFVPKTGMAGKTGFFGFDTDFIKNRFFVGGHSLYFEGDSFMREKWLPLLNDDETASFDQRSDSNFTGNAIEQLVIITGRALYPTLAIVTTIALLTKYIL